MSSLSPSSVDAAVHSVVSERSDLLWWTLQRLSDYRQMARPRIMVMSAAAVTAGFILASPVVMSWLVLGISIIGICCLVAASSVLNQVMEAATDKRMNRTSDRPVASGRISPGWFIPIS